MIRSGWPSSSVAEENAHRCFLANLLPDRGHINRIQFKHRLSRVGCDNRLHLAQAAGGRAHRRGCVWMLRNTSVSILCLAGVCCFLGGRIYLGGKWALLRPSASPTRLNQVDQSNILMAARCSFVSSGPSSQAPRISGHDRSESCHC